MNFYLIYWLGGRKSRWEAMTEINVPDPRAFPAHGYKKYEAPREKYEKMFKKLFEIRDDMNNQKVLPSKEKNVFPELTDILPPT